MILACIIGSVTVIGTATSLADGPRGEKGPIKKLLNDVMRSCIINFSDK